MADVKVTGDLPVCTKQFFLADSQRLADTLFDLARHVVPFELLQVRPGSNRVVRRDGTQWYWPGA